MQAEHHAQENLLANAAGALRHIERLAGAIGSREAPAFRVKHSYHFPANFSLKQANICVFCNFAFRADLPKYQEVRWLCGFCLPGSSPAAPAIHFSLSASIAEGFIKGGRQKD